ncbi:gamma-glutamylcyclotransferase [Mucilaginibacter sp. HMF5004]|uniref:gamma-glutamylcyclotransferase family protein n=1 Tax=Mucilaginibacter rivuli TaxID=2857527 RepID=UPI001C5FE77E|nr:gamma-glutamylcyclotransferase family protein [Mucilaginibacter rivuli]MBW4890942.1 gamma-glutamylcyclotransferase [Mucilaginibacter rivuli]
MILFAYASNMNMEEFRENIPLAQKLCNAYIPGYEFCFNKSGDDLSAKANIQPSTNAAAKVWGVLISIPEEQEEHFHENEELDLVQMKCMCSDGEMKEAAVLISKPHAINNYLLPYDWYKQKIVVFAKMGKLPEEYIKQLERMEAKIDPDTKRRERRLEKIAKYL